MKFIIMFFSFQFQGTKSLHAQDIHNYQSLNEIEYRKVTTLQEGIDKSNIILDRINSFKKE